jgi:hypothetical protein
MSIDFYCLSPHIFDGHCSSPAVLEACTNLILILVQVYTNHRRRAKVKHSYNIVLKLIINRQYRTFHPIFLVV